MSPNPTRRVLSTFLKCDVKALLMGGQACILYGAAEFSRDSDFVILASIENLERLKRALRDLDAKQVFLPPLEPAYLERGHACHFRCSHPEAAGFRIDLMSVLRGCDSFPRLWERRELADLPEVGALPVLSLPDLVCAKKTQRDKDWPMIRRLVDADHSRRQARAQSSDIRFWLREARTPALLKRLAAQHPDLALEEAQSRHLLRGLPNATEDQIDRELAVEQDHERRLDRAYWEPLRRELEAMRESTRLDQRL